MDKTAIRNFAIEARKILMKSAITEAGFYGITKDGCKDPVQKGNDFEVYETVAGTENRIFGDDIKRRANLVQAIKTLGFEQVIEETAYTWFNRIIAIRFMEVNNYLPTRVRVLSSETGSGTPDIITQADTVELNLTSDELEKLQTAKRENRYDDAFRMLFIKQCNELNAILPGLFEKTDDYMELLLKITYTGDGVIRMLVDSIPEDNFNVETEGQVEIIGWMYQYYNTELKDDTFAKLKKNVKITKERIPAATQLFTPDWIVRYMVENSLGRVWIEHLRAVDPSVDEKTKAEEFGWKYYLQEAEQEDDVQAQLVEIRKSYKDLTPQDITCIDPCMGSGHILVYMFDVLMDIYRSEGFSEREAVFDILEKNIRGLDIDRRAYQLSYFALMMKARGYNRIFFRGHEDAEGNRVQAMPRVYAIEESNSIDREQLKYFGEGLDELSKNNAINQMNGLLDQLINAREFGSLLNVEKYDWALLRDFLRDIDEEGQSSLFAFMAFQSRNLLQRIVNVGEVLSEKYDAIVTNPPYMGLRNMGGKLVEYCKAYYPSTSTDMFSCFIERGFSFAKDHGFNCMVTMQSWMFLSSFEKFRKYVLQNKTVVDLIHMDNMVMGIAFGTAAFVLDNSHIKNYRGTYDYVTTKDIKEGNPDRFPFYNRYSIINAEKFNDIEGNPMAYWASERTFSNFRDNPKLGEIAQPRQGVKTLNNDYFMKLWHEVEYKKIGFGMHSFDEAKESKRKWFPYTKGGEFRKWYGNNDYVVNWENDGAEMKAYAVEQYNSVTRTITNLSYWFRSGLTWSMISSGSFSLRYVPGGFGFDARGSMMFMDESILYYVLGFLCSKVVNVYMDIVSPTISFEVGNISKLPVIIDQEKIATVNSLVEEAIDISRWDWDSRETSWGFKCNEMVKVANGTNSKIKDCFEQCNADRNAKFNRLLSIEKELNSIFISIYGLSEELSPEVNEKDITISKMNEEEAVRNLLSYAVGCIFGRFSAEREGLLFAGGSWDDVDLANLSFVPDKDGIIPITDESYFDDDIVSRTIEWIRVTFGDAFLNENIDYIANNLHLKGNTSREIIRNYYLENFYKEHCERYSITGSGKRPIYWLFDSGKENGFKCLMYLHRYNADTVGVIRSDYLTKSQNMIENALKNAEYAINTSSSAVDRAQATKKRDKYIKQLSEIRAYYPALSHIALQRIDLDLDDGVKVNYEKFQNIEVSIEGEKKQKVNLLAKI